MTNNNSHVKVKMSLRFKFIAGIFLIGTIITIAVIAVGLYVFNDAIRYNYNNTAYQVAQSAADLFTENEIAEWADITYRYNRGEIGVSEVNAVLENPRYNEIKEHIVSLRKNMEANDIFVCVLDKDILRNYDADADKRNDWNPLFYIMDSYHVQGQDFKLGDCSPINVDYIDIMLNVVETGNRTDDYLISSGEFGTNTTAAYPVIINGQTAALVCVEIPMSTLENDAKVFIISMTVVAGVAAIILIIISIVIIVRTMVRPIMLVSAEAENFIENNNEISVKLDKIKTHDEIELLSRNLLRMEIGINEYIDNITKITAEKERIGAELNVATQIQADMLPSIFPPFPERTEFDIYAKMTPAKEVGGDFYDFFLIDDDHLALVMADVSGKGVPAALFMVIAKTLIKNHAQLGEYSPAKVLMSANEQLCEGNEAELFVTVWLAVLEISTGKGKAANAGHEHPTLRRRDGKYELVEYRHSPAVATMEGMRFREHDFELYPGDSLFVYTDGVAEATDAHDELYGTERMLNALNKDPDASPKDILTTVKASIDEFVGDAPQFDDITMLCLKYFGTGNEK